ncbi:hypothetical protein N7492_006856 [Penicillium capsulatum]|uniref:Zn(2)-C6 fungal-type domain-containing protein n=1 Tax=Penicillium capsulatum TaxID=69766 RepID=A0A9W9LL44_9EURO|nr:hypothetical protein N7492_006856 [Penicillium capsulatum]KAJ6116690.1 hypothetical protein N7512_006415 [Penicillium capsulatum]
MQESGISTSHSKGRKKVKTGCRTCKIRRVKCDESRPACRRCVSTGRTCDGYGIWGGGGTPFGQPQSNRALSTYCTPIPVGSLTREEQGYFEWFMEKTTKKFAGLFPSDFWETLVFQASAQEPAQRIDSTNAMIHGQFPPPMALMRKSSPCSSYNKAIQYLRASTDVNNRNSLRVALITCLVFTTLEYLRGQYQIGSAHLRYGIQLLANLSAPKRQSIMSPNLLSPAEDFAHSALIDSYSRLSIQSAMFGHVPSRMCVMTRDPQTHALPYFFPRLLDARQTMDDLLNRIHCLKQHYFDGRASRTEKDTQEMRATRAKILEDLSLWRKAYNASMARIEEDSNRRDKFGFLLLRTYHEMANIMALVSLAPSDEMAYDSFTPNFLLIMGGFYEIWKFLSNVNLPNTDMPQNFRGQVCNGHGFTLESGYILPIYYTALKCRIPRIRRQAIRILRNAPHREGVWNGPLLADVLEEVLNLEEGDRYAGDPSIDEPMDAAKLTDHDLSLLTIEQSARISDIKVILPNFVHGETYLSYEKRTEDDRWVSLTSHVRPGRYGMRSM